MELVLGTVQYGLSYDVTNSNAKVGDRVADKMFEYTEQKGITKLGTAHAYGDSEYVVGRFPNFEVISKVSFVNVLDQSHKRLRRSSFYGLLLHDAEFVEVELLESALSTLFEYKTRGIVEKIGVSIYNPGKSKEICKRAKLDIVQVPLSVIDQRFADPEVGEIVNEHEIELHARSLFLQGALLSDTTPENLRSWEVHFKAFREFCSGHSISKLECCLFFAKQQKFVKALVVGAASLQELSQIFSTFNDADNSFNFCELKSEDDNLINPALWKK